MHARAVNPSVIELEQRTDRERIIQCFVRPSSRFGTVDVLLRNRRRILTSLRDDREQGPPVFRDRCSGVVGKNRLYEFAITQKLCRNCSVGTRSE